MDPGTRPCFIRSSLFGSGLWFVHPGRSGKRTPGGRSATAQSFADAGLLAKPTPRRTATRTPMSLEAQFTSRASLVRRFSARNPYSTASCPSPLVKAATTGVLRGLLPGDQHDCGHALVAEPTAEVRIKVLLCLELGELLLRVVAGDAGRGIAVEAGRHLGIGERDRGGAEELRVVVVDRARIEAARPDEIAFAALENLVTEALSFRSGEQHESLQRRTAGGRMAGRRCPGCAVAHAAETVREDRDRRARAG